jgi:hypothetical protein
VGPLDYAFRLVFADQTLLTLDGGEVGYGCRPGRSRC